MTFNISTIISSIGDLARAQTTELCFGCGSWRELPVTGQRSQVRMQVTSVGVKPSPRNQLTWPVESVFPSSLKEVTETEAHNWI